MTLAFWKDAAVRAVKTFAQVVLALMGTGSVGITSLDWPAILSIAATAGVASVLTSVTSLSNVGTASTGKHVDTVPVIVAANVPSGVVPDLPPVVDATPTV